MRSAQDSFIPGNSRKYRLSAQDSFITGNSMKIRWSAQGIPGNSLKSRQSAQDSSNSCELSKSQVVCPRREGVQSSSIVITATQICFAASALLNWYSPPSQLVITVKFCFLWFEFNALLTQFSTSIRVLWHLYWLKLNFQIIFRFVLSTKTEI